MRTLLIAIGNELRRDDGVAHAVLERINPGTLMDVLPEHQLTPELAAEIAGYGTVMFLDADAGAAELIITAVNKSPQHRALTHVATPQQIVELSRQLFGFEGQAFSCRIPANDFSFGKGLSQPAREFAAIAAREIGIFLDNLGESAGDHLLWNNR